MLSYSQWMEVTQKKKCENLLSLHTQPFLRDSCGTLKEIYYITSLLLISHYAHLFPVGGFRLQGLFLCLPQISSRLCSSVNCLNTEAGLRWCNLLPQHFSGWVLGSRCLFGPQTATRSSTSPPLPDRLWYWFDGVGYCSSIVKLDVTVSAAAGSNDSEWWARALGRGGISGWFISGDRHLNVLLMTSSSSEQDAGGRRSTLDKGDCINVVLLACCHNGPGPIH